MPRSLRPPPAPAFPALRSAPVGLRLAALFVLAVGLAGRAAPAAAQATPDPRSVLAEWSVPDPETGDPQSVVRFTEENGYIVGRIVRLVPTEANPQASPFCGNCRGRFAGVDLREVDLLWELEWNGREYAGGYIVDPLTARTHRAVMRFDGPDQLRVRRYLGLRAFGRTQVWQRVR